MAILISGCSFFASSTQTVSISGEPAGANVVVNGMPGTAPCTMNVSRNRDVVVLVSKKGYVPYAVTGGHSLSVLGVLDVIGFVLIFIPGIGLFAPGAYSLDQTTFHYNLTPEK